VAVSAVVFDVGETLVNEERYWRVVAEKLGLAAHVVFAALGVTIARGEHHRQLYAHLGVAPPDDAPVYERGDFYPDALVCLEELRRRGFYLGIAGNQSHELEAWMRAEQVDVDLVASSSGWGVEKPSPAFFARVVAECGRAPHEIAYVGDRVDNDVEPALAAGMVAVHIRRGPWGHLHRPPSEAIRIRSLDELPQALVA
jgi:FMN phosphatase YigB (HAD superfamily)